MKKQIFPLYKLCASSIMRLTKLFKALKIVHTHQTNFLQVLVNNYFFILIIFFFVSCTMIDTFTHKCYYWMTTGRGYYVHDFLGLHFSLEVYDTFYLIISNHFGYFSVASSKLRIFFIYGKIYLQPRNATRTLKIRAILFYNLIHLKHKALYVPSIDRISQTNL